MKSDANPLDLLDLANAAPRCTAHSRRTAKPCHAPAVTGWRVCRVHGAGGGHKAGPAHSSWKHGTRSSQWTETRRMMNELVREARAIEALIGKARLTAHEVCRDP